MKAEQVELIARIGTLAVETLLEYLRQAPTDEADAVAQDRACLALMGQQQKIADALLARLGVPDVRDQMSDVRQGELAEPPAAPPPTSAPGASPGVRHPASGVDLGFIAELEGQSCMGYVPLRGGQPIGNSGVTVGIGVDLGQRSEAELVRLGLSLALVARLKPYLGLRRADALQALSARPLRLSTAEAGELSGVIASDIIARVAKRYWADAGRRFADLPPAAQTVIASVAYQYGDNLPKACPRFWRLVAGQDWTGAVAELENFGDDYAPRRRKEAKLLRTVLGGA
jgi:hypothetical protein